MKKIIKPKRASQLPTRVGRRPTEIAKIGQSLEKPKSFKFADRVRLFVLGLPHTKTIDPSKDSTFTACAYTTKVWHLCKMMSALPGYEVIHLGNHGSDPICTEHVDVGSPQLWDKLYGRRKPTEFFDIREDGEFALFMQIFAASIRMEILKRTQADPTKSIICVTWGGAQIQGVAGLPHYVVESGIGYPNCCTRDYRIYESYAWKHFIEGKENAPEGDRWYHWVIPNAFDPEMFGPVVPAVRSTCS